jgi:hypothetical protein
MNGKLIRTGTDDKEEITEIEGEFYTSSEQKGYLIINLLEFLENDKMKTFKIEKS